VTLKLPTHSLSQPGLTRSLTEYSTSVVRVSYRVGIVTHFRNGLVRGLP